MKAVRPKLPLVYSCSGCSSAAQMANQLAVRLDREGLAEMSCIAGVGGGVPPAGAQFLPLMAAQWPVSALAFNGLRCALICIFNLLTLV